MAAPNLSPKAASSPTHGDPACKSMNFGYPIFCDSLVHNMMSSLDTYKENAKPDGNATVSLSHPRKSPRDKPVDDQPESAPEIKRAKRPVLVPVRGTDRVRFSFLQAQPTYAVLLSRVIRYLDRIISVFYATDQHTGNQSTDAEERVAKRARLTKPNDVVELPATNAATISFSSAPSMPSFPFAAPSASSESESRKVDHRVDKRRQGARWEGTSKIGERQEARVRAVGKHNLARVVLPSTPRGLLHGLVYPALYTAYIRVRETRNFAASLSL